MIKKGETYLVKDDKKELGFMFHWMIGMEVKVTSEEKTLGKYPIEYDKRLKPENVKKYACDKD